MEKELSKKQKEHIEKHMRKHLSKHVVSKAEFLGAQFKQHVSTAIIAAFSFLIALAWKDLIVHFVESTISKNILISIPYLSDLITAVVVSIIAVIGIILVTRWAKKPEIIVTETKTQ